MTWESYEPYRNRNIDAEYRDKPIETNSTASHANVSRKEITGSVNSVALPPLKYIMLFSDRKAGGEYTRTVFRFVGYAMTGYTVIES